MKLKDILAVVDAGQKLCIWCKDVDGTNMWWQFRANNVPLIFWDRKVLGIATDDEDWLLVKIEN